MCYIICIQSSLIIAIIPRFMEGVRHCNRVVALMKS